MTDLIQDLQDSAVIAALDDFSKAAPENAPAAFLTLIAAVWDEGAITPQAAAALPALIERLAAGNCRVQGNLAILLGLIVEARNSTADIVKTVRQGLDLYLELLASAENDSGLTTAMLYLLGHFPDDRERILAVANERPLDPDDLTRLDRSLTSYGQDDDVVTMRLGRVFPSPATWAMTDADLRENDLVRLGLVPAEKVGVIAAMETRLLLGYSGAKALWTVEHGEVAPTPPFAGAVEPLPSGTRVHEPAVLERHLGIMRCTKCRGALRQDENRATCAGKHSAHARGVMGSAGCRLVLRGECLRGRAPGRAEHEVMQDVHGVLAVLAGGVDVASDVEAVLGDVVAGEAAGDFLLGFQRADAALRDIVRRPHAGVLGEQQHVTAAAVAEFEQLAAGLLLRAVLRAGHAGHAGQPGEDRVPELVLQRAADAGGDGLQALLAGGVPGMDQAAQRPLRLHGPDRPGVRLGAVLEIPQQVSQACLVPGEVLPGGAEVVLVPVRNGDAGEAGEDPGLLHRLQAAGAQVEGGVLPGERAEDVLLLPGRPGPQRRLVEPRHAGGGDQGADQPHHAGRQVSRSRQAGVDEPRRDLGAGHVADQLPAPLDGHVLEDDQVNRQRPDPRPDRQGGIRHARRARRDMGLPAGAFRAVQVVLHPLRRRGRDLLLLIRPGNTQVSGTGQVQAAGTAALGVVVLGPVRGLPAHRGTRAARLLSPLPLLFRPLRGAPLLPRRLPPRQVIRRRRHRGVPAVPRPGPLRRRQLLPQVSDHRLQRRDPLRLRIEPYRLLPDQRITRIPGRRRIGHSPKSSPKPRTPPRQRYACRQNVTIRHSPQQQG